MLKWIVCRQTRLTLRSRSRCVSQNVVDTCIANAQVRYSQNDADYDRGEVGPRR